jgi:hypothetical protein
VAERGTRSESGSATARSGEGDALNATVVIERHLLTSECPLHKVDILIQLRNESRRSATFSK